MRRNSFKVLPAGFTAYSPRPGGNNDMSDIPAAQAASKENLGLCSLPKIARTFKMKTYAPKAF